MTRLRTLRLVGAAVALAVAGATTLSSPAGASDHDLAGWWRFNEGSGQVARDSSFSGNPGQLGSTPEADPHDPTWVRLPGFLFIRRAALHFDGLDHVRVSNAAALEPDGVTVVARLRADATPGPYRYVISKGALACWTASYGLYTDADGGLRFYTSDGSSWNMSDAAGPELWDGRWHTVVGAFDGSTVRLWVDGRQVGQPVPAPLDIRYGMVDGDDLYIGTYAGPCGEQQMGFRGDLDGVAVIGRYDAGAGDGLVD
jgi:hypothetical protein